MSRKGKKPNPRRQWNKDNGIKNKWLNAYYSLIVIIGLALLVWEIFVYRMTIIPIGILIMLMITVSFLALLLEWQRYDKTYDAGSFSIFYCYLTCLFSWGGIACSIFMLTNYYYPEDITKQEKFQIVARSSMSGGKGHRSERQPLFSIDYHGQKKEIVFGHQYYPTMDDYNFIELTTKKGFWGFTIIKDKELLK